MILLWSRCATKQNMIKPLKGDTSTCVVVGCFHVLEGKIVDGRAQQLLFWVHVSELNSAVCQHLNQTYFFGGEANLWDFMNLLSRQLYVLAKQMSVGKRVRALLANNDYYCCKEIIWGDDRGRPRPFVWICFAGVVASPGKEAERRVSAAAAVADDWCV